MKILSLLFYATSSVYMNSFSCYGGLIRHHTQQSHNGLRGYLYEGQSVSRKTGVQCLVKHYFKRLEQILGNFQLILVLNIFCKKLICRHYCSIRSKVFFIDFVKKYFMHQINICCIFNIIWFEIELFEIKGLVRSIHHILPTTSTCRLHNYLQHAPQFRIQFQLSNYSFKILKQNYVIQQYIYLFIFICGYLVPET